VDDQLFSPAAKVEWAKLLDRIEVSIDSALDATAAQEATIAEVASPKPAPALVDDGFLGLQSRLNSATKLAETVEALLAADEQEALVWVGLAARVNARLATVPGPRLS
jgi:hypothetical protein